MGNRISYSSDDEFLRITLDLSQNNELKKQLIYDLKFFEYIQLSSFQLETLSLDLILLKIHVNDLEKVPFFLKNTIKHFCFLVFEFKKL